MSIKNHILVCFFLLLVPTAALADVPNQGALDIILNTYINAASGWEVVLHQYATRLFWILVLIDFVWMAINLTFNPGEFGSLIANLTRKVLFIGFFFALLQNGPDWAEAIITSFQTAANTLSSPTSSSPSGIFGMGFNLAVKIFDKISFWKPGDSLGYVIAGYIIMIIFALIAAMVLLVTVQAYITIYAGILLLGFGGSTFTKDIALIYLKSALSIGAKLFIMLLITRLGMVVVDNWIQTFNNITFKQMTLFIGASIVLLALVKGIPDMVGDMINGFSWGTGESLMHTTVQTGKVAAGAAIGGAAGAAGGYMAVTEASKLASAQGAKGVVGKTAAVAKNLATAATEHVGQKLSGTAPYQGTTGGKTAEILRKNRLQTEDLKTNNQDNSTGSVSADKD